MIRVKKKAAGGEYPAVSFVPGTQDAGQQTLIFDLLIRVDDSFAGIFAGSMIFDGQLCWKDQMAATVLGIMMNPGAERELVVERSPRTHQKRSHTEIQQIDVDCISLSLLVHFSS